MPGGIYIYLKLKLDLSLRYTGAAFAEGKHKMAATVLSKLKLDLSLRYTGAAFAAAFAVAFFAR